MMNVKCKIGGLMIISLIIGSIAYTVYSTNDKNASLITLANIEALAGSGESSGSDKRFTVSRTEEVEREEVGDYVIVTSKTTITCPHGGSDDCTFSETTFKTKLPKG